MGPHPAGGGHTGAAHNGTVDEPVPVTRTVDHGTAKLMPDIDRARAWLLTVDGAPQSYVDLDDPTHLEFEYTRRFAHLIDGIGPAGTPIDVLHLGAGALTLPRYTAATRPGSRQQVVEIDRGLLALVRECLPLPVDTDIEVHPTDAREWIAAAPLHSADLIIADVFGGSRVPGHLTSVEYARAVAGVLRADGVYAANLADSAPFAFLRRQLATFHTVFDQLAVIAEPAVLRGRRFGNVLLVASAAPLDIAGLARRTAADPFPARVEHGAGLVRLMGAAEPVRDRDARPSPQPPDGAFGIG